MTSETGNEKWLTTTEVAERLGTYVKQVHRWREKGWFSNARPKSPVPGSPITIPESDVVAFEEARDNVKSA